MSEPILAGIETEYGLLVENHGADTQVENATTLVRSYPGECLALWDYRNESPRNDLRGFKLDQLEFDPRDAEFDVGKTYGPASEVRADRILPNGGRLYNDHGHPEYATPECWTLDEIVRHDIAGQHVMLEAAKAFEESTGLRATLYKNNTDYHGSSYGTHESYLIPRTADIEGLAQAVVPMLVARSLLCGAGKVGSESGAGVPFQNSQRADFFVETMNAETLHRRPIFNTRDEPHADPGRWMRLHVISGDANMMASCTKRKVGLVKVALLLHQHGFTPQYSLADPVAAIKQVSRDLSGACSIALKGGGWTTPELILQELLHAALAEIDLGQELADLCMDCIDLLKLLHVDRGAFARRVDWAAKYALLEQIVAEDGLNWTDAALQSYCLEYQNIDPEDGLYFALEEMGAIDPSPKLQGNELAEGPSGSRAVVRGVAVSKFADRVITASWRSIVIRDADNRTVELDLQPNVRYPDSIRHVSDVESFINLVRQSQ